jgi:putative tryptophan/tyrosine transport system substrate-binding protein
MRIGILRLGAPAARDEPLRSGLAAAGYREDRGVVFEARYAGGQPQRVPALAADLVAADVDVIVAVGAVAVHAALSATKTVPIVFAAVVDPVSAGLVQSLQRPAGNVTGITSFDPDQPAAQLAQLARLVPDLERVGLLSDDALPRAADGTTPYEQAYDSAAQTLGLTPVWIRVQGPAPDLRGALAAVAQRGVQALLVLEVPVNIPHMTEIARLATEHRLPSMFPAGYETDALLSYGTRLDDAIRRLPAIVDRILKGAAPADLPIEFVTRRHLQINRRTASLLGLPTPADLPELSP